MAKLLNLIVDVGAFKALAKLPSPSRKLGDYPPNMFRACFLLLAGAMGLMIGAVFVPIWLGVAVYGAGVGLLVRSWTLAARGEVIAKQRWAARHGIDLQAIKEADRTAREELRLRKVERAK